MISKLPFKFSLSLITFLIGFLSVSAQVSLREISLKEQIDNSSLVVEGKVIAKRSFWDADRRMIYTSNTVEIYKVFKGESVGQVEIITIGGIVGLNALMVSHGLKLGKGSIGVFTLYDSNFKIGLKNKTKNKQFKAYSGIQGFYAYNLEENIAVNPFSKRKGIKSLLYKDILDITKKSFKSVTLYDIESEEKKSAQINSSRPPTGIMFTPTTIEAGIGSVLTITGSGFGTTQGKVGFRNSDDGGASYFDALDSHVLSWGDELITVEVPVIGANDVNIDGTAGTGTIRVTDAAGNSDTSNDELTISYAEINVSGDFGDGFISYQTQHYDDNSSGGYTWIMEDDFFNESTHVGAPDAFLNAFDNWRCETKVNWEVSGSSTSTSVTSTTENIIAFDVDGTSSELAAGVLGTCYYTISGTTCTSGIVWFVTEFDIIFDRETSWFFGTGTIASEEYDFETVALHELGHGHQLGHVINTSNVMHFVLGDGPENINTILDANSVAAANDVHSRSTTSQMCNPAIMPMTNYAGSCNLSIEDFDLDNGVAMYPNPASQQLFIKNVSSEKLERIIIFDVSGRIISDLDVSKTSGTKTINLNNTSKGIYFVNIYSGPNVITKKLIVE